MFSSFPRLSTYEESFRKMDKSLRRVQKSVFPEHSDFEFMHMFLLSDAIKRQKLSGLPAKIVLTHIVPHEHVETLLEVYKEHNLIDAEGMFTIYAKEFSIYCLVEVR